MVEKYLEKLYQEMYENKLNLEQEHQRSEMRLNNNIRFVETLKESLDEDFESFSPRKVDEENHRKIESLLSEQEYIRDRINKLQIEIKDADMKIKELEEVLENIRQNQGYIDVPLKQNNILSQENISEKQKDEFLYLNEITDDILPDFTSLIHKIEMCNKLAEVDPIRCKLEISEIEKSANKIVHKLQNIIN